MKLRESLLWAHRWVGVVLGLVLAVVAVTGGLLVFDRALMRWQYPGLFPTTPRTGERAPIAASLANLTARQPDARVAGIILPRHDDDVLMITAGGRTFHADPQSGEILGSRPRVNPLVRALVRLHVNLMAETVGATVVIVATSAAIGMALTGLWLWWPLKITWFRRGANFRRFNLDLHSVAGLYTSLFCSSSRPQD